MGSVKKRVKPCPTTDTGQIFPPCISMIRLEIGMAAYPLYLMLTSGPA